MNPLAPFARVVESTIVVFFVKPRWCAAYVDRPDQRAYAVLPEEAVRALRQGRTCHALDETRIEELTPWKPVCIATDSPRG